MSELNAGIIRGRLELDRSPAVTSMAAAVVAIRNDTTTLRGMLASPFAVKVDAAAAGTRLGDLRSGLQQIGDQVRSVGAIGLHVDQSAVAEVRRIESEVARLTGQLDALGRSSIHLNPAQAESATRAINSHLEGLLGRVREINSGSIKLNVSGGSNLESAVAGSQRLLSVLGVLPGPIGAVASRGLSLTSVLGQVAAASGGAGNALATIPTSATAAASATGVLTTAIGALSAAALVVGPPLLGLGITMAALHSTPVRLASELRQTAVAFEVLTGSAANAQRLMVDLKQLADTTPLQFPEIASAAKQLLAMGVETDKVTGSLRMLGDMSILLNQPLGEMAYLYGQIKSQGRAMTQDLNQFAGRGVPIYTALAKTLKTNEIGVRAMAEAGQIGFAQIEAALQSLTGAGGKFSGGLARQGQELAGLESTAADAYASIQAAVGEVLIKNLDLAGTIRQVTDFLVAVKPTAVGVFESITLTVAPFVGSLQSVIGLGTQVSRLFGALGGSIDSAFGEGTSSKILKVLGYLSPLSLALKVIGGIVDALAWTIKQIADAIEIVNYFMGKGGAEAAKNAKPISDEEVAAAVKARREKREAAAGGTGGTVAPAGAAPATPIGTPAASVAGGTRGSSESDAERSAERIRNLQGEAIVTQLRAAGREYEAAVAELGSRFEADVAKAKSGDEIAALQQKYTADRQALDLKHALDQAKALNESTERTLDAQIRSQIAKLKAAGEDLKARLAEIALEYRPKLAAAANPKERQAIEQQQAAEVAEATTAAEDKARKNKQAADEKLARDKEQRDAKASEVQERTDAYRLAAQAAALEARGRRGEAELLRFDGEWKKRLAAIKDDGERSAAYAQYEAERVLKMKDAAVGPRGLNSAALSSLSVLPATVHEAQERVGKAKPGSGERELARLDLRDSLGKVLTPEEQARRIRLGERFGRDASAAGPLPPIPSPVAGIGPALARATPGRVNGGQAGAAPVYNVTPAVNVDEKKLADVCVKAMTPVVDRKLDNLRRELSDAAHARGIGGRI